MIKYTKEEKALIWLDSFVGLEYKIKRQIIDSCQNVCEITQNLSKFCTIITDNLSQAVYNNMQHCANDGYMAQILKGLSDREIIAVCSISKIYPEELLNTPAYPIVLYCKGDVGLLNTKKFAIVGSRRTSAQVMDFAKTIASNLTKHFTIISGLAEGGDTAALEGALTGGKAITVLAYGFDYVYPEENRQLLNKVVENGLAITEHTPEVSPMPYLFPVRNRIIAGLATGVLVVSGAEKSGTFYTGNYAVDYGRDLFAVPGGYNQKLSAICNSFIKRGAHLTDCVDDILNFYNIDQTISAPLDLTEDELRVLNVLKTDNLHLNALVNATGLKIYQLLPILSSLEIKKLAEKSAANIYTATTNKKV